MTVRLQGTHSSMRILQVSVIPYLAYTAQSSSLMITRLTQSSGGRLRIGVSSVHAAVCDDEGWKATLSHADWKENGAA